MFNFITGVYKLIFKNQATIFPGRVNTTKLFHDAPVPPVQQIARWTGRYALLRQVKAQPKLKGSWKKQCFWCLSQQGWWWAHAVRKKGQTPIFPQPWSPRVTPPAEEVFCQVTPLAEEVFCRATPPEVVYSRETPLAEGCSVVIRYFARATDKILLADLRRKGCRLHRFYFIDLLCQFNNNVEGKDGIIDFSAESASFSA